MGRFPAEEDVTRALGRLSSVSQSSPYQLNVPGKMLAFALNSLSRWLLSGRCFLPGPKEVEE